MTQEEEEEEEVIIRLKLMRLELIALNEVG